MKLLPTMAVLFLLAPAGSLTAQTGPSYRLDEYALNAGGAPASVPPSSTSYRLTVVALGDGVVDPGRSGSVSYSVDSGFLDAYAPPGEVRGLTFSDSTTLTWSPEPAAGTYNLYRSSIGLLDGLVYGACDQQAVVGNSAPALAVPSAGDGDFFLVTVVNRLREEGTKGPGIGGAERGGDVCP